MKTCPVCELDLDDAYLFCPDDGSSLETTTHESSAHNASRIESNADPKPDNETPEAVVLYCPTCAAEYPLTFSTCPVHDVQLVKHRIPKLFHSDPRPRASTAYENTRSNKRDSQFGAAPSSLSSRLTSLHLERPQIENSQPVAVAAQADALPSPSQLGSPQNEPESNYSDGPAFNDVERSAFDYAPGPENSGFRVAAIGTVIALVFFGLIAFYMLASNLSRRRPSLDARVANQTETAQQPLPFVPTPPEARDYKEEPSPGTPVIEHPVRSIEKTVVERDRNTHKPPITPPPPAQPASVPGPTSMRASRVSNPPMPDLPRGNTGGFDARLVRVRGRQMSSGFHYDLTFNMQEQAGRSAQWQRLLITTRSASGMSRSQAIPFVHRLGATGALTFTIGVEMAGRSEADWQGRVVCTTLGWDNNDRPLQASFGASVRP